MSIKIPFVRKKVSTFVALSAAIALLLLSSSLLPLSNFLLQPAQAQTPVSFRTTQPADGTEVCSDLNSKITFNADGTASSGYQNLKITNGTFQVTSSNNGQVLYKGSFHSAQYNNNSNVPLSITGGYDYSWTRSGADAPCIEIIDSISKISTDCSESNSNRIQLEYTRGNSGGSLGSFSGPVECSLGEGHATTPSSPSSSATGTAQDSDSDGIPDSSDKCPHNSHHRCFKEGTSTTSTDEQQPSSSSSNGNGNQTRQ